jgi:hypothetical protein
MVMKIFLLRASLLGFVLTLILTGCISKNKNDTMSMPVGTDKGLINEITQTIQPSEKADILRSEEKKTTTISVPVIEATVTPIVDSKYRRIEVDGDNISGNREKLVVVDVGYGDREYWAYTNEYGQLIKVTAKQIIPQNQSKESVLANGRYFKDEAKVPGTEREDLDEGHVIADSLGGVSNAYNITPQNSVLNRNGNQAYMEKVIRDVGGCTDFTAIITYPDTKTQIPSHYSFTYTLKENVIHDEFDNVNPDVVNQEIDKANTNTKAEASTSTTSDKVVNDISRIDTNHNGKVSIAEAKAAGFKMPITTEHWLYKYMTDGDNDGMVGE